jgi:hypothetical protein
MKEFIESNIKFEFDERNWDICQYDASSSDFRNKVHLSETKAVDFIGVYNNKTLILFEIKSFKGFGNQLSVQNRLLNSMDELSTEVAQKVRDTVAVVAGFNRTIKTPFWQKSEEIISNVNKQLMIIAWVEEDITKQKKNEMSTRLMKLKQKLNWLTTDIYIENIKEIHSIFDGFNASSV